MKDVTDENLIKNFLEGDVKSFEELVHRYEIPLMGFLQRYTGNYQEAEEVFQETFLRVYTKAQRFDPERSFKTWVYTIALNLARTALKRRYSAHVLARSDHEGGNQDKIILEGEAPEEYSAESVQERSEVSELIRDAVLSLPEKQRDVFVLYQYQNLCYTEIASVLGRPVGTIKSQMHYAIQALRDRLKDIRSFRCQNGN